VGRLGLGAIAAVAALFGLLGSACIENPDCGICDPNRLVLQSASGPNYLGGKIHLLSPPCEGDACPPPLDRAEYFVEPIYPCEETEEAIESPRGPKEHCKLSPLLVSSGIELLFNNLLESESVELVRKDPTSIELLYEVYDWKTRVLEIHGPLSRTNGDFHEGEGESEDIVTRSVNLSCIDNLRDNGQDFGHENYEGDWRDNPCNKVSPETELPLKLRAEEGDGTPPIIKSYRGELDWRAGSCDTPDDEPDDCCSVCDYELSVNVAKYGLREPYEGVGRPPGELFCNPNDETAIECDPLGGDKYIDCASFVPWVDRSTETIWYDYEWYSPGQRETFHLPLYDQLRSTHPDNRPTGLERRNVPCAQDADCHGANAANLPGTACVGELAADVEGLEELAGIACDPTRHDEGECVNARCVANWFVTCRADADTTGPQGYCRDARYYDRGAPACLLATTSFVATDPEQGEVEIEEDARLAECDRDQSGLLTAMECCKEGLGTAASSQEPCTMTLPCSDPEDPACDCPDGEDCCPTGEICSQERCWAACDPLMQASTEVVERFDRNLELPGRTKDCLCEEDPPEECEGAVDAVCRENGVAENPIKEKRLGQYAVKLVTREGGVIYDPAVKGIKWLPAHLGNQERAMIEACAEQRNLIGERSILDGWRAHDHEQAHSREDYDRAMCSGSEYTIVFAAPGHGEWGEGAEHVRDKVGNTMADHERYSFETSDFHLRPSPSPYAGRVGACDPIPVAFSNKYDLSPENLNKIEIWSIDDEGGLAERIAGGHGCTQDVKAALLDGEIPCLTVGVGGHATGELTVQADPAKFGAMMEVGELYRVVVPGLEHPEDMADEDAYGSAFWDVCGMPLVTGGLQEGHEEEELFVLDIQRPPCREDKDGDDVALACDNAPNHYNPGQENMDADSYGDVMDLCPTVASGDNTGDSDNDGVGNDCDRCRQPVSKYNEDALDIMLPAHMYVRNVPAQTDTDQDGIGDVCDNCIHDPNCEDYGPENPHAPGDPISYDDPNLCQRDDLHAMVGTDTTCEQTTDDPATWLTDEAVGPVGFADDDDFDQDGLANVADGCPRQPVVPKSCDADADCGPSRACEQGICNHLDSDGDGVGDVCDTCPSVANPMQVTEGGTQEDDEDADFVGNLCEAHEECVDTTNPRRLGFHEVSVAGQCCVALWPGDEWLDAQPDARDQMLDPDGVPIRLGCPASEEDKEPEERSCRPLPEAVKTRPGMVDLPAGCEEALEAAGISAAENRPLSLDDVGGDPAALWEKTCSLPQWDQDFDGIGDECDLCPFAFDPENIVAERARWNPWPSGGKYCTGEYAIPFWCDDPDTEGTDTGTDTDTDPDGP